MTNFSLKMTCQYFVQHLWLQFQQSCDVLHTHHMGLTVSVHLINKYSIKVKLFAHSLQVSFEVTQLN